MFFVVVLSYVLSCFGLLLGLYDCKYFFLSMHREASFAFSPKKMLVFNLMSLWSSRYLIGGSVLYYPQLSSISSYQLYVEVSMHSTE